MKTHLFRIVAVTWLAVFALAFGAYAQSPEATSEDPEAEVYDHTDIIYDEVGCKLNLHLQYDSPLRVRPATAQAGGWYIVDHLKPKPGQENLFRNSRNLWRRGHGLCRHAQRVGGWQLFRVAAPNDTPGAFQFILATPVPGEWHELSQIEYRPSELFTQVPEAVEHLLAQSTGYRELVWWAPCSPLADCRVLANNY